MDVSEVVSAKVGSRAPKVSIRSLSKIFGEGPGATAAVARYEQALVTNDIATLDGLFWNSAHVLRYRPAEILHGYEQIAGFRATRSPLNLQRTVLRRIITTFGKDFATANVEFLRAPSTRIGRQSQAWVRMPDGWKVVAAHISLIEQKK